MKTLGSPGEGLQAYLLLSVMRGHNQVFSRAAERRIRSAPLEIELGRPVRVQEEINPILASHPFPRLRIATRRCEYSLADKSPQQNVFTDLDGPLL